MPPVGRSLCGKSSGVWCLVTRSIRFSLFNTRRDTTIGDWGLGIGDRGIGGWGDRRSWDSMTHASRRERSRKSPLRVTEGFRAFVLEQLRDAGEITPRAMFGGVGLYCDGIFFGIIAG